MNLPLKPRARGPGGRQGSANERSLGLRRGDRGKAGVRRPFGNGDLKLILLAAIAEAPSHGYELIKWIEDRVGGGYSPSPGVIYPTLTLLEELGFLAASVEGAKKLYEITPAGVANLAEQRVALAKVQTRMRDYALANDSDHLAPVHRAVENLRLAVRMRIARGRLSEQQISAIRAVLDGGAAAIDSI